MKTQATIVALFYIVILGCGTSELSREEAFRQIQEKHKYPKAITYEVYCSDPEYARLVLSAGLENEGLLTVQKTQKLSDVGNPLIQFTSNAKPFLLPTSQKEKDIDVQIVKIADEELMEVTSITKGDNGKTALAEYTTSYKNQTPFSSLSKIKLNEKPIRKAKFSLHDNEWKLD